MKKIILYLFFMFFLIPSYTAHSFTLMTISQVRELIATAYKKELDRNLKDLEQARLHFVDPTQIALSTLITHKKLSMKDRVNIACSLLATQERFGPREQKLLEKTLHQLLFSKCGQLSLIKLYALSSPATHARIERRMDKTTGKDYK